MEDTEKSEQDLTLTLPVTSSMPVMTLGGQRLNSFDEIIAFLTQQRSILPLSEYQDLRVEAGYLLSNIGAHFDEEIARVYAFFSKDSDWGTFKGSHHYRDTWTAIEKRVDQVAANRRKVDAAIKVVREAWPGHADAILEINKAQQFRRLLGQIARNYGNFDEAMSRICRAVYWRLTNRSRGRSSDVEIQHSDLRRVIDYSELGAEPLTTEELKTIGCRVGQHNLLECINSPPSGFVEKEVGKPSGRQDTVAGIASGDPTMSIAAKEMENAPDHQTGDEASTNLSTQNDAGITFKGTAEFGLQDEVNTFSVASGGFAENGPPAPSKSGNESQVRDGEGTTAESNAGPGVQHKAATGSEPLSEIQVQDKPIIVPGSNSGPRVQDNRGDDEKESSERSDDQCYCRVYVDPKVVDKLDGIERHLHVKEAGSLLLDCYALLTSRETESADEESEPEDPPICRYHLNMLRYAVGLKSDTDDVILKRLQTILDDTPDIKEILSDAEMRSWFVKSVRPKRKRNCVLPYRFSEKTISESSLAFDYDKILKDFAIRFGSDGQDFFGDLQRYGSVDIAGVLSWWFEDDGSGRSLGELAAEEIQLYAHHSRHVGVDVDLQPPQSPWLETQLYSLSQLLLAQDPALYVLNVCLRPDHNHHLLFYPEASFAVNDTTTSQQITFNGANFKELCHMYGKQNYVRVMVPLSNESVNSCSVIVPRMHDLVRKFCRFIRSKNPDGCANITEYSTQDFEDFNKSLGKDSNLAPVLAPITRGSVRMFDPRIPCGAIGEKVRYVLFPSLIGQDKSGKHLIPNYLGSTADHLNTLDELGKPEKALLPLHEDTTKIDEYRRFPAAFKLPSLGPIGGAITGMKKWSDIDVIDEMQKLLGDDRELAWNIIIEWRERALKIMHGEFKRLIHLEKTLYPNKSFSLIQSLDIIDISSDEELITDTSDSEIGRGKEQKLRQIKAEPSEIHKRKAQSDKSEEKKFVKRARRA